MSTDPADSVQIDALFDVASQEAPALDDLDNALTRLKRARAAKSELSRLGAPTFRRQLLRRRGKTALGGDLA